MTKSLVCHSIPQPVLPITARLYKAASIGDINLFNGALKELSVGAPELLHMQSPQKNSVLHVAASFGHKDIVELILGICPSLLTKKNETDDTALHYAARDGHELVVDLFIGNDQKDIEAGKVIVVGEGNLIRTQNVHGDTALHEAIKHGHEEIANKLINADPELLNLVNKRGESAFYLAANVGLQELVADMLGRPINHLLPDVEGKTALHAAIKQGHTYKEKHFEKICPPYQMYEKTPGIVELLVKEKIALLYVRDSHERSPIHYAIDTGSFTAVRCLLRGDTSIAHHRDYDGSFPIHMAARNGNIKLFQEILQHCPDSRELHDRKGRNALHVATESRHGKMVKYILAMPELEKLINEKDSKGDTPLHIATRETRLMVRVMIVTILLKTKKADLYAVNEEGLTPFEIILSNANTKSYFQKLMLKKAVGSDHIPDLVKRVVPEENINRDDESTLKDRVNKEIVDEKNINKGNEGKSLKERTNTLLIVATLIATITFAAGFTMPGGFNNDNPKKGQDNNLKKVMEIMLHKSVDIKAKEENLQRGMALMLYNGAFDAFVISDTIAMYTAIAAALTLMWAQIGDITFLTLASRCSTTFLAISLVMVAIAFGTGIFVVVSQLKWLSIFVGVISIYFIIWILGLIIPIQIPMEYEYRWIRFITTPDLLLLLFASKFE